ncbi:MAG: hypothetical protein M1813_002295 [Trichoglossum hirsutum]|nr:MAG: hypothetical protein M1813_002295 [Trichoglossum hirsutum]
MNFVSIRSQAFPGTYIKADGTAVTQVITEGGGQVSGTTIVNPFSRWLIEKRIDGTVAIRCPAYDDVYLRLDGRFDAYAEHGSGVVNLQYTAGPYCLFRFAPQSDGAVAIESVEFPGRFLRIENTLVNAQFGAGAFEKVFVAPA